MNEARFANKACFRGSAKKKCTIQEKFNALSKNKCLFLLLVLVLTILVEVEVTQEVAFLGASDHADVVAKALLLQELLGQVLR